MQAEPLIAWPEPVFQFLEFVGAFLAIGPVGFRYFVLPKSLLSSDRPDARSVYAQAARRAAGIGLVGALLGLLHLGIAVPAVAERRHLSVGAALAADPVLTAWIVLTLMAVLGYVLA